jgi:predicted TIM-barrel fold metal-dependent hydrolase
MVVDTHVAMSSREYESKLFLKDKVFLTLMKHPLFAEKRTSGPTETIEDYIENMENLGVEKLVVHSLGYAPETCRELNDITSLLCQKYAEQIVGFATVPLSYPEQAVEELDRAVKDLGLEGLKIYPKFQGVRLDSTELKPVFCKASQLNIPILTHSDLYIYSYTGSPHSKIEGIDDTACNTSRLFSSGLLDDLPNLKIIAAHLGGGIVFYRDFWYMKEPKYQRIFDQMYFDIAPAEFYSERMLKAAISMVGADRIMFGTDYSLFGLDGVKRCVEQAKSYDIPDDQKEKILRTNAIKLLNL